jgi:hypothetical protein
MPIICHGYMMAIRLQAMPVAVFMPAGPRAYVLGRSSNCFKQVGTVEEQLKLRKRKARPLSAVAPRSPTPQAPVHAIHA